MSVVVRKTIYFTFSHFVREQLSNFSILTSLWVWNLWTNRCCRKEKTLENLKKKKKYTTCSSYYRLSIQVHFFCTLFWHIWIFFPFFQNEIKFFLSSDFTFHSVLSPYNIRLLTSIHFNFHHYTIAVQKRNTLSYLFQS